MNKSDMKTFFYILLFSLLLMPAAFAGYTTPGSGIKWTLDDLVTNSNGSVTFVSGEYFLNDTVKVNATDTLTILSNATMKFAASGLLVVRGTLIVNPPSAVLFTAQNTTAGYFGMRIDTSSTTLLRKLTFEYAVSLKISDCSPTIDSCVIQYNNNSTSTTFGNGAIAVFRASPVITNTRFLNNNRAAIQGGANIANAPKIISCYFFNNDITNQNVPQINLGQSGVDTVIIKNNYLLRGSTNSGGIGFLPIGDLKAVIEGNVIKNNRYGITISGGSNINARIAYNEIDSNNTQNNPLLGGSGIAIGGGSATSQQNTVITGNLIRWNLWGVTIQNRAKPNLGNVVNSDTSDDGKNQFIGNTNASTPFIDLYNNTVDTIYAQNNYWGTTIADSVEPRIYHFVDLNTLGPVIFTPSILPVELVSFTAAAGKNSITLNWSTSTELNNSGFIIERKHSNNSWENIGFISGSSTTTEMKSYSFTDSKPLPGKAQYRLKQIDFDGSFVYSKTIEADLSMPANFELYQNYPNPFNPSTIISYSLPVEGMVRISIYNALGELVKDIPGIMQSSGYYQYSFNASDLGSGVYFYKVQFNSVKENLSFSSVKKMLLVR